VYCTLPDAARATGRAAPAADRRRPAQLRPVEIHRPTIAPTSLRRAERGARAAQITPHRRAITDADAAPPRQRPNALYELSPPSPSCSPTPPSLPQLHLPPRRRAAGARRRASSATRPCSPATSAPLSHVHPLALARSAGSIDLIGGAEVAGPDPRSRALGRGRWISGADQIYA